MSATNRHIEAELISLDEDDPKAKARIRAKAEKIATESGLEVDAVLRVITAVRADKRKSKRARNDFYETPTWVVDAIVPYLPTTGEPIILDAGSGTGAIAARLASLNPKAEIVGVEKSGELVAQARERGLYSVEFVESDFLKWSPEVGAPDLVIMNPPFSRAYEFIAKAREIVKRGGSVCALLRLNWLAGKCRRDFLKKHTPDVFVLSKRPSFVGGKTDATEYAWMVWGPAIGGKLSILMHDDKSKRRPSAPRTTSKKAKKRGRDLAQANGPAQGSEVLPALPP